MASKHIYELGGRRFESFRAHQCTFSGTYEPRQRGALLFLPSGFSPPTASEVVRPIHGPNPRFARARLRRSEFVPDEFVESFRAHQCTSAAHMSPANAGLCCFCLLDSHLRLRRRLFGPSMGRTLASRGPACGGPNSFLTNSSNPSGRTNVLQRHI